MADPQIEVGMYVVAKPPRELITALAAAGWR